MEINSGREKKITSLDSFFCIFSISANLQLQPDRCFRVMHSDTARGRARVNAINGPAVGFLEEERREISAATVRLRQRGRVNEEASAARSVIPSLRKGLGDTNTHTQGVHTAHKRTRFVRYVGFNDAEAAVLQRGAGLGPVCGKPPSAWRPVRSLLITPEVRAAARVAASARVLGYLELECKYRHLRKRPRRFGWASREETDRQTPVR